MVAWLLLALAALILAAGPAAAQTVPPPRESFGFEPGEDRKAADWNQLTASYEKLGQRSQRVTVDTFRRSTMGQPFVMLTITSPENYERPAALKAIQEKLADPRKVSGETELQRLREQGGTVVLLDIPSLNPDSAQWEYVRSPFEGGALPWLYHFPVRSAVEGFRNAEYYIPGSILRLDLNTT